MILTYICSLTTYRCFVVLGLSLPPYRYGNQEGDRLNEGHRTNTDIPESGLGLF